MQSMLYNVAENIVRECGERIDDAEVISTWMDGAVKLLTLPSVAPDLQEAASGFMVALGSCPVHCNAVSTLYTLFRYYCVILYLPILILKSFVVDLVWTFLYNIFVSTIFIFVYTILWGLVV